MVASASNMIPRWFIIFALSLVSFPSQTEEIVRVYEGKGLIRSRRQESKVCAYGTYDHKGLKCCLCNAGQLLKEHCTKNHEDGKCERCADSTYNSYPNFKETCEPCTRCEDNANLAEHEGCAPDRDAKCKCKKDHFCGGKEEPCKLCNPCKVCGNDGIKVACTATNDTVCNDKSEGGNESIIIPSIVIPIVIVIVIVAFLLWRKKKRSGQQNINQQANGNANEMELHPLRVPRVDLSPHLSDIAEVIGWNDMKVIAMRANIPQGAIDASQLDHPHHTHQQTIQLLKIWVERQGMDASVKLIQTLENSGKRLTAEKVGRILSDGGSITTHVA